jgi:hypothetical protein
MAADVKVTEVDATLVQVANIKAAALTGTVSGTVGVKVARLTGATAAAANIHVPSVAGAVSLAAGAPTVTPPSPQDVVSGALVTLTASGVAISPATIASYTWRLVSKDVGAKTPQFVTTTGPTISLYVPPDVARRTYTVGVVAKDSSNRVSAEGTTVITVEASDYLIPTVAGWSTPGQDSFAVAPGVWS